MVSDAIDCVLCIYAFVYELHKLGFRERAACVHTLTDTRI